MSNIAAVSIRFHLDREEDRTAYAYLQSQPDSMSRTVVNALNAMAKNNSEDVFLKKIEQTITHALQGVSVVPPTPEPDNSEESLDTAMDFLSSF